MIFTVAIDGPAAAGKGTVARAVAQALGFAHLDTGLLYRAVGLRTLGGQDPGTAARGLDPDRPEALSDPRLRHADVAEAASRASAIPEVRAALLGVQRAFARRDGGAVLDGRDIGTVVCPEAEAKLFVTATPEARARRRLAELRGMGQDADLDGVLAALKARDDRDAARAAAPLRAAADAVTIDTSDLRIEDAVAAALHVIRDRLGRGFGR